MKHRIVVVVWLAVVWVLLWGDLGAGTVVAGLAVAVALVTAFAPDPAPWGLVVRPIPALRFVAWFARELVVSTSIVAWEVVTPRSRVHQAVVSVPISGASDALLTLVVHAITLTPGSIVVDLDRGPDTTVLYVKVMHLKNVETVRHEIQRTELLAVRAFGPPECLDATQRFLAQEATWRS